MTKEGIKSIYEIICNIYDDDDDINVYIHFGNNKILINKEDFIDGNSKDGRFYLYSDLVCFSDEECYSGGRYHIHYKSIQGISY